ncbi:hypothetical protein PV08_03364 [Exophiala spinifera]|uniref:BZIP domain-containing protein n=1 Tax=Exophiala spinifera TaxID=91928 RepID=A0A0D2C6A4_9EURO|nr:uncharacterized protein PV08_03364 [Exophiala spinifera]KIW19074.1 hypothetical protein PV08_03364 [Exophiala spinifera]
MTTKTATTAIAQRSATNDSAESSEKGVSSRRLKKREIDRRCQRQARERTKSRIAHLEGLVEEFRRQDATGQVALLMKQLQEAEAERNLMAKTLKDIQKALDLRRPPASHEEPVFLDEDDKQKPSIESLSDDTPLNFKTESEEDVQVSVVSSFDRTNFTPSPNTNDKPPGTLLAPPIVQLSCDNPGPKNQALVQCKSSENDGQQLPLWTDHWARPRKSCTCHTFSKPVPGQPVVWRGNYWVYANQVLSQRFGWPKDITPASAEVSDDVPVRALLEGWDSVAKRGPLHPSWQILRQIDENLFCTCPDTERLAVMRAMHALIQFHTESTSQLFQRLPPWYMRRPSQSIAHSYAIDYYAWPGLRERFIFGEHNYCQNEFWRLFCKSLRILWPYEFRDCYTREVETGLYKINPMFDQRLGDIKCWTMGPDIFQRYPELYSDMPTFNQIPQQVPTRASRQENNTITHPRSRRAATSSTDEQDKAIKLPSAPTHYVPMQHNYAHVQQPNGSGYIQSGVNSNHSNPNPHAYNLSDITPIMALDAFAFGAISEVDFAAVFHPEASEGYPTVQF